MKSNGMSKEMESSDKARCVFNWYKTLDTKTPDTSDLYDPVYDPHEVTNISQLVERGLVKEGDYRFGDVVQLDERWTAFVGKGGELVCGGEEVVVPFEITKYLEDATRKYDHLDPDTKYGYIDLRNDDDFFLRKFGKALAPHLEYCYDPWHNVLIVTHPDGNQIEVDLDKPVNLEDLEMSIDLDAERNWLDSQLDSQMKRELSA